MGKSIHIPALRIEFSTEGSIIAPGKEGGFIQGIFDLDAIKKLGWFCVNLDCGRYDVQRLYFRLSAVRRPTGDFYAGNNNLGLFDGAELSAWIVKMLEKAGVTTTEKVWVCYRQGQVRFLNGGIKLRTSSINKHLHTGFFVGAHL